MRRIGMFLAAFLMGTTSVFAQTTRAEALACFNEALDAAKAGARPLELITRYLDYRSLAANAAQHTAYRAWSAVPATVQTQMVAMVYEWFADEKTYDKLDLSTVVALRAGKVNGGSYELQARYGQPGEAVYFGLLVYVDDRCRVIDVSESNAWLSYVIGQKF